MDFYLDNNYFFITCRTVDGRSYFYNENVRQYVLDIFRRIEKDFNFNFSAFSILQNHYHFLLPLMTGKDIAKIINIINGNVSFYLKDSPKPLWDNYHNSNVFDKDSYMKVLGYIAGNPFKHGLVKSIADLGDYKYSNYNELEIKFGKEGMYEIIGNVHRLNWDLNS